jgi:hypothetical protein
MAPCDPGSYDLSEGEDLPELTSRLLSIEHALSMRAIRTLAISHLMNK